MCFYAHIELTGVGKSCPVQNFNEIIVPQALRVDSQQANW